MITIEDYCASLFKVIAQPTRMRIIEALRHEDLRVADLYYILNEQQSNISRHISILWAEGLLVKIEPNPKAVYGIRHKSYLFTLIDQAKLRREMLGCDLPGHPGGYIDDFKVLGNSTTISLIEALSDMPLSLDEIMQVIVGRKENIMRLLTQLSEIGMVLSSPVDGHLQYSLHRLTRMLDLVESAKKIVRQETLHRAHARPT